MLYRGAVFDRHCIVCGDLYFGVGNKFKYCQKEECKRVQKRKHNEKTKEWARQRRIDKPDEAYRANKEWRNKNIEKVREQDRKKYAENPQKHRDEVKKSYQKNPRRAIEYTRKWQKENPDRTREMNKKAVLNYKAKLKREAAKMLDQIQEEVK